MIIEADVPFGHGEGLKATLSSARCCRHKEESWTSGVGGRLWPLVRMGSVIGPQDCVDAPEWGSLRTTGLWFVIPWMSAEMTELEPRVEMSRKPEWIAAIADL